MKVDLEQDLDILLPEKDFGRRNFLVTSITAGFALAIRPVAAQTITTSTEGLIAGEVKVPVKDGSVPAYRAMPATGGPFPTVLVVHEAFAVHEHIQDICRRLAKVGYYALAPDLFARYGDVSKMPIADIVQNVMSKVTAPEMMGDLDACVVYAKVSGKADTSRLAITGFCFGGGVVWQYAAHNRDVKAAVAWYGQLARKFGPGSKNALELAPDVAVPVLGLYGGKDQGIPLEQIEKMRAELRAANKPSEIVVYPDAGHAFNADYRPEYRKEAAEDGWKRMLEWFKKYGA